MYIILKIHAQVELADLFLLFVSCLNDSFSHYVPLQIALFKKLQLNYCTKHSEIQGDEFEYFEGSVCQSLKILRS